jgi:hypothetical protein
MMIAWKRPIALVLLASTLLLTVTGLWLWLGFPGGGRGFGGAPPAPSTLKHLLKDLHLYASWAFMAATVCHLICNGRAMLRHLGFTPDARNPASPEARRR